MHRKEFFFLALWLVGTNLLAQTNYRFLQERDPSNTQTIILTLLIIVVVSFSCIMFLTIFRGRTNYKKSLAEYESLQSKKRLSVEQVALSDKIVRRYKLRKPHTFLQERNVFNLAVGNFIRDVVDKQGSKKKSELYDALHYLRSCLGFDRNPAPQRLMTTKELPVKAELKITAGGQLHEGFVSQNKEDFLHIKLQSSRLGNIKKGQKITLNYYNIDEGHYKIPCHLHAMDPRSYEVAAEHNNKVKTPLKRKAYRAAINQDCVVGQPSYGAKNAPPKQHQALIVNLSEGGMKLVSRQDFSVKERLALGAKIFNRFKFSNLHFTIIRKRKNRGDSFYTYNARFENLPSDQKKIINNTIAFYKRYKKLIKLETSPMQQQQLDSLSDSQSLKRG